MKYLLVAFILLSSAVFASQPSSIETSDISNFWNAVDHLRDARNKTDSIQIIQQLYLDKATPEFKKFIRARNFSAEEYVTLLSLYPKFWKSIRPLTEKISQRKTEITSVLQKLAVAIPGFKTPDVCFAIGCIRSGGTTSKHLILIGAEMAAADSTVDKSELDNWRKSVLGNTGDIVSMVAHEAIHTQQTGFPATEFFSLLVHRKLSLLNICITEGSADFFTEEFLGLNINAHIYSYGLAHQCELWKEFNQEIKNDPFNYSNWIYNGSNSKNRPADLGYYMGYRITKVYYNQCTDKKKALKTVLQRGKYKKVFRNCDELKNECGNSG